MLEFAYNSSLHPSTGYSSLFLNTRVQLLSLKAFTPTPTSVSSVDEFVSAQAAFPVITQDCIADAHTQQAAQANCS